MKLKGIFNSISFKLVVLFLAITLPFSIFLIINNNYSINVVRNQVSQSNKNLVSLYLEQIDKNLYSVDSYFYGLIAHNPDLVQMELSMESNFQDYYSAKIRLSNELSNEISKYDFVNQFFVYSSINDDLLLISKSTTLSDQEKVRNAFINSMSVLDYSQWSSYRIDNEYYLYHIIKYNDDIYIGAWIDSKNLMIPISLVDFGENGCAILTTDTYQPMDNIDFINEYNIDLKFNDSDYTISGEGESFLIEGQESTRGNFCLVAVIPEQVILERLPYFRKIILFIPFVTAGMIVIYLFLLRRIILIPVKKIMSVIKRIRSGDSEIDVPKDIKSDEFYLMNDTINNMVQEIHALKIQVYEEEINRQKFELENLKLQFNPHFFLNTLDVMYQLACSKRYELIKEIAYCLMEYFRFIFRSNMTFISLEDEIKHTRNYLRIQELRYPDYLTFKIEAPESLLKYSVPPLIIQIFAENSIKHAVTLDNPVQILVNISFDTEAQAPMLKISIRDTGPGFPEEILSSFVDGYAEKKGSHIGLWNLKHRLDLLYDESAHVKLSNHKEGGALVEIWLPLKDDVKFNKDQGD